MRTGSKAAPGHEGYQKVMTGAEISGVLTSAASMIASLTATYIALRKERREERSRKGRNRHK
jgi:hypothetical protein